MKRIKFLLLPLLIIFFSVNVYAYDPANSGISYSPTSDSMVYTNTQNVNVGAIVNAFNTIPAPMKSLFKQEGVKFYYTEGLNNGYGGYTISKVSYNTATNKITSIALKPQIYIYTPSDTTTIVTHECGHALDGISVYITGSTVKPAISETTEWHNILNRNVSLLANIDAHSRISVGLGYDEAFAEAFRLYCTNPNGLNNACPEVYNFVSAQVAKYSQYIKGVTKKNFDAQAYADLYPDLKAAFGYNKDALWSHYINHGKAEGRTATAVQ